MSAYCYSKFLCDTYLLCFIISCNKTCSHYCWKNLFQIYSCVNALMSFNVFSVFFFLFNIQVLSLIKVSFYRKILIRIWGGKYYGWVAWVQLNCFEKFVKKFRKNVHNKPTFFWQQRKYEKEYLTVYLYSR